MNGWMDGWIHKERSMLEMNQDETKLTTYKYKIDGRIAPRSGLASKHHIDVGAGVIDADYRGPVRVLLFNFSDVDFQGGSSFSFQSYTATAVHPVFSVSSSCGGRSTLFPFPTLDMNILEKPLLICSARMDGEGCSQRRRPRRSTHS